jgi:hypothetical protein
VRNVGTLPNVTTVHAAITGSDGPVSFYPNDESIASSALRGAGTLPAVSVDGLTIPTLMARHGVESVGLLKLDIEGSELDALRVTPLDRVDELIAEIHYDLIDGDEETLRGLLRPFRLRFEPGDLPELGLLYGSRQGLSG